MTGAEDEREEDAAAGDAPHVEADWEVPWWLSQVADVDITLLEAILRRTRQGTGAPDRDAVFAMEEPLRRLAGGCMLLYDLAAALHRNRESVRAPGLLFLARALEHEAINLHRLYHGHEPRGC